LEAAKINVLIAGGTGLVGIRLTQWLIEGGYQVSWLSRKGGRRNGIMIYSWDPSRGIIDDNSVLNADVIINLAGANLGDKRWTKSRKKEILDSRIQSLNLLFDTVKKHPGKTRVMISPSAIGIYGETGDTIATESSPTGEGFQAEVCRKWEAAAMQFTDLGIRTVILRKGVVLAKEGGALKKFILPARFRIAPVFGKGQHYLSWIHLDDACRAYIWAIENSELHGVYNVVAPAPVTYNEFINQIKKSLGGIFLTIHIPFFVLKLMLGELSGAVTESVRVSSSKIEKTGLRFSFNSIQHALHNILKNNNNRSL
jgi:uncharacterized protein (TIGR01777 family)